jgi:SAM-dependent methyltransferase
LDFCRKAIGPEDVRGKSVLEVGALDVNGSARPIVEAFGPSRYVGVDLQKGPSVDEVCDAARLVSRFGRESFDFVVTTEMLEHVRDWRAVVRNLKGVVRRGGTLRVTTRSLGFHVHGYPWDFWRYEIADMERIFADFEIELLESDELAPGVFLKARKPDDYTPADLSGIALHSMLREGPAVRTTRLEFAWFRTRRALRGAIDRYVPDRLIQSFPKSWRRFIKERVLPDDPE